MEKRSLNYSVREVVRGAVLVTSMSLIFFLLLMLLVRTSDVATERGPEDKPSFGWIDDPAKVREAKAELGLIDFCTTPAGKAHFGDDPKDVFLWKAVAEASGKPAAVHNQNPVGSCVSFGTSRAFEKSLAVQIKLGDKYEFKYLVEEAVYGGSRVEIGGGTLRGDGSLGVWAAKFVKQYGGIPRGTYTVGSGKTYALEKYDPQMCREWGSRGVPDDLEAEVKKYPAGDAALVKSWAEAKKALAQGYGIAVCSGQGFSAQRDSNGVARAQGSWAHCMCLDGYHLEPSGQEYGHIENSWGSGYHTGPVGWGDPPVSGFWAEASVINRMLAQGDSWAFSAVKGFPSRRIDWFAMNGRERSKHEIDVALRQNFWREGR